MENDPWRSWKVMEILGEKFENPALSSSDICTELLSKSKIIRRANEVKIFNCNVKAIIILCI